MARPQSQDTAERIGVECLVCGALPGDWCETEGGRRARRLHAGRLPDAEPPPADDPPDDDDGWREGRSHLTREQFLEYQLDELARLKKKAERQRQLAAVASFTKQAAEVRDALDEERLRLAAEAAASAADIRLENLTTGELVERLRAQLPDWPNQLLELAIDTYCERNRVDVTFAPRAGEVE